MACGRREAHHSCMIEQTFTPSPEPPRKRPTISELRAGIDDRDETIRLLNEALSRALDELERGGRLAA